MEKYHFLELDDATRDYLIEVRDHQGAGMPGMFVPLKNPLPVIGLIVGMVILAITAGITLALFEQPLFVEPLNVAMLQTAGLLLGGWMIVAAIRVWLARSGRRYLGHFLYADAVRLYEAKGSTVRVSVVEGLSGARGVDNYNEQQKYQSTKIALLVPNGQYTFTVSDWNHAQRLVTFFNTLAFYRMNPSPQPQSPALVGVMARNAVLAAEMPAEMNPSVDPAAQLEVPHPLRVRRAPTGLLACLIIVALAVGGVFLFHEVNTVLRDNAVFDMRQQGTAAVRLYLADPRLTRHRDKVIEILAQRYDPVVERLRQNAKDKELSGEFLALFWSLRSRALPIVNVRAKETPNEQLPTLEAFSADQASERASAAEKLLKDGLQTEIGSDLIVFETIDEQVPAMLDIQYRFVPENSRSGTGPGMYRIEWTVRVRKSADEQGVSKTWSSQNAWPIANLHPAVEAETRQTLAALGVQRAQPIIDIPIRNRNQ